MQPEMIQGLAQFGAAGLMGALWVWERRLSRRREHQLDAAPRRLIRPRHELRVLMRLVQRNTRAIERFEQTQRRFGDLLEEISDGKKRHGGENGRDRSAA